MYGLSSSQTVSSVIILVSIVFYFAANNGLKQNVFLYFFAIALTMLIVGIDPPMKISCSWMRVALSMSRTTRTGRKSNKPPHDAYSNLWRHYLIGRSLHIEQISVILDKLVMKLSAKRAI